MSFVNYTPSKERTDHKINEAIMKYGKDIAIINGEDNWNACKIFHIGFLLNKFGIEKLGDFHDQVSGITNSGCVIKKSDLKKFIEKFNKRKWILRHSVGPGQMFNIERIKIFDPDVNEWKVFFEIRYGDTQYINKLYDGEYYCRKQATCTVDNFENCEQDKSYYFSTDKPSLSWKKIDMF
jgi:hypothetical protein